MNYNTWLHLISDFTGTAVFKPCPNCGEANIAFQFVGDEVSKAGHLYIWCSSCLHGIHVSRVKIPVGVPALPYDIPDEELRKVVPKYKLIVD